MNSLMNTHDLIVIGAGPAGMAAAATAASLGLRTAVLDEQPHEGGQIYRNVTAVDPKVSELLGPDYTHGRNLAMALHTSHVDHRQNTLVWDIAPDLTVTALHQGRTQQLRAPQIIAATGAMERPSPVPGWTLPGVMNAGAAQIAMKTGGAIPEGRVVLAGAGPLLLLVACQLLDAGANVVALVETTLGRNRFDALRHLPAALTAWPYLTKGLKMMRRLRASKVPWFTQADQLVAEGGNRVEALAFFSDGRTHRVQADCVLLHHGVIPNTQLSRMLRLKHRWDERQMAWHVVTDDLGQTSMPGIRMAGDSTAITGALAAEASGSLAALGAAAAIGHLDNGDLAKRAAPLRRELAHQRSVRPFLDELYRPPSWVVRPADDTIVCRCEEVTAGRVREMAKLGCVGPNQTKFFSRCGMGPCQGRVCGTVVTQVLAAELGTSPDQVGAYRIRAPLKPIPMGALSALAEVLPILEPTALEHAKHHNEGR